MSKRYLWVVEVKDRNGKWSADDSAVFHVRSEARRRARSWASLYSHLSFRVTRYSAEDK